MALNFGIEPPQWLQNQDTWIKGISSRGEDQLLKGASFIMQAQKQKLDNSAQLLEMQQRENAIQLGQMKIGALNKDYSDIPNWLQAHPTWESRQDANWPAARSPEGDKMLNDVRLRDSQSIQAKAMVESTHDFASRVNELRKTDPAAAGQFAPYISGKITPTILQALSVAEDAAKVHQENQRQITEMQAAAGGAQKTTEITDKGVKTTFKPAPANENAQPQTKDIGGGVTLSWMPGGKTLHVIKANGEKTEFTVEQLKSIGNGMASEGDPRGTNIVQFLRGKASDQVDRMKNQPVHSSSTNAPPMIPNLKRYNPDTKKIE